MTTGIPSAEELIKEAEGKLTRVDVNSLHVKTYELLLSYKAKYYEQKVDDLLLRIDISGADRQKVRRELLKPVSVGGKNYANFMEEASRRISQSFQPLSGSIAELCVVKELEREGLTKGVHYSRRIGRTDLTLAHPNLSSPLKKHRVEVKNVSLRERGVRGLSFDGDSMFGFFNQPEEFSRDTVRLIDENCMKTSGYCYVPPETLEQMQHQGKRFRENTRFGSDMKHFVTRGTIP